MGGLHSEIDDDTTSIALEAAHFVPEVIARAGRRHKVSSEAGKRNERGVDRDLAPYASARAAALLLEFGGGHYVGMTAVEAGQPVQVIELPVDRAGRRRRHDDRRRDRRRRCCRRSAARWPTPMPRRCG